MTAIHKCERCGISKEELKLEIINEIMRIIYNSCKGSGGSRSNFERPSAPSGLGVGSTFNVPSNYAISAGVLEDKIKYLQHQIDLNSAKFSEAKSIFESKTRYQRISLTSSR